MDIPPVSVSSLGGESEGESDAESAFSSSTFSSEEEGELRDSQLFEAEDGWIEDGESGRNHTEGLLEDLFRPGEAEGKTIKLPKCNLIVLNGFVD